MTLQQQIANELGDSVEFIEVNDKTADYVWFFRNGAEYSARLLKNGNLKKGSVRRD